MYAYIFTRMHVKYPDYHSGNNKHFRQSKFNETADNFDQIGYHYYGQYAILSYIRILLLAAPSFANIGYT